MLEDVGAFNAIANNGVETRTIGASLDNEAIASGKSCFALIARLLP
ncbi:MAG TPA: hypothetical protein VMS37_08055 [Verrucomicrobiae bacterium]|nr:hypothetical protein [Verrucomicrobiae bacterium]